MVCMTSCALLYVLQPLYMSESINARESFFLGNTQPVVSSSPGVTQSEENKTCCRPTFKALLIVVLPLTFRAVPAAAETIASGTK